MKLSAPGGTRTHNLWLRRPTTSSLQYFVFIVLKAFFIFLGCDLGAKTFSKLALPCTLGSLSFVLPLPGWHVRFTTDLMANLWSSGTFPSISFTLGADSTVYRRFCTTAGHCSCINTGDAANLSTLITSPVFRLI